MTKDSNFDPNKGQVGPYSFTVTGLGSVGCDVVKGMGLIGSRHIQYRATYQLMQSGVTPPPTPPPTTQYVTEDEFKAFKAKLGAAAQ